MTEMTEIEIRQKLVSRRYWKKNQIGGKFPDSKKKKKSKN